MYNEAISYVWLIHFVFIPHLYFLYYTIYLLFRQYILCFPMPKVIMQSVICLTLFSEYVTIKFGIFNKKAKDSRKEETHIKKFPHTALSPG